MRENERRYVKGIKMCVLYAGGTRKSRKLAKLSKGRIPARRAAMLYKDAMVIGKMNKSFYDTWRQDVAIASRYSGFDIHPVIALVGCGRCTDTTIVDWLITH